MLSSVFERLQKILAEQFEIDDNRSLDKMYKDIAEEGLQPVLNDYLYV